MSCDHEHLVADAQPYVLQDEGTGQVLARTLHLKVSCQECGLPFRFEGVYQPPPPDNVALLKVTGPWASAAQTELAMRILPTDNPTDLMWALPSGRA